MVVDRITELQWQPLKLYFTSNWLKDKLKLVENIYHAFHDPSILIYFTFLKWVLPKFVNLNKLFQNDRPVICLLHSKMTAAYIGLFYSYMKRCNNPISIDPEDELNFLSLRQIYLGVEVLTLLQKPDIIGNETMIEDVLGKCRLFLITSCKEIKARFDFNNTVLNCLENLTLKKVLSDKRQPSLISTISLFTRITKNLNIQRIDDSWRQFDTIKFDSETTAMLITLNAEDFWIKR